MHYFKLFLSFLLLPTVSLSYAQKNKKFFVVDNFDVVNKKTPTSWFTYNDSGHGGKSTSENKIEEENNNKYMQLTYKLEQAQSPWAPYTALSNNISASEISQPIQAICYRFKGNAHMLVVKTTNIKDYCYYNISIPASTVWTTVTVPVLELKQPTWGTEAALKMNLLEGLSWQVSGKTDDTGIVSLDDVHLLFTPQLVINPLPFPEKLIPIDSILSIHSSILKEDRKINIYLPPSYNKTQPNSKKYPVVYLLDGEYGHVQYVGKLIEQLIPLNYNTTFPEMIIVGISNTNRTRDLSPTHSLYDVYEKDSKRFEASGGGAAFMDFIEKELMPVIEKTYATANYKTLIGHSLGGLTVINTLLHKPDLFDAYLALDPSLWWDNELLLKQATEMLGKIDLKNKKLYIAIANDVYKGIDVTQAKKETTTLFSPLNANLSFIDILNKFPNNGLKWKYDYYPDENHRTVVMPGELAGLKYLFELNVTDIYTYFSVYASDNTFTLSNTLAPSEMGYTIYPPEKLINTYAYSYLEKKNTTMAFSLFQLNVTNYPFSPYAFDAFGDYYVAIGDTENARKNYSQALHLSNGMWQEPKIKLDKLK